MTEYTEQERAKARERLEKACIAGMDAEYVDDVQILIAALRTASQRDTLCRQLQQKCSDWGTYWRAPDAHGVILSQEQAHELLRDALGVEVEIKPATPASASEAVPASPWLSIDRLEQSDDLFWFAQWDGSAWNIDGPRTPQAGGYDADEWDWFAPCEAPAFHPAPANGEPINDDELPGMWERADFMGGATDCDASGEGRQGEDWQSVIQELAKTRSGCELLAKLCLYELGTVERCIAEAVEACERGVTQQQGGFTLTDSWAHRSKATQQQAGQAVAFVGTDGKLAWIRDGQGIGSAVTLPVGSILYTTPQTPDGYVLVPREPTEAMIEAICTEHGSGGWPQGYSRTAQHIRREQASEGYRAMLAAAPASHGREGK